MSMDRQHRALVFAHQEWLGFVQPTGLVVAPFVMVDAQVVPDRNMMGRQREFRDLLEETGEGASTGFRAPDLRRLFLEYLRWEESDLIDATQHRDTLEIALPELQAVLSPTWAVPGGAADDANWIMLIGIEDAGADLDRPADDSEGWNASRHARFERLLRETGIPIGLLATDERVRLVYAPKGETSGHLDFDLSAMAQPAGRPILAAFDMLLCADSLFSGPETSRLPALLAASRDAQAGVSTKLARQVLAALYELLRGFVAADARRDSSSRPSPDELYGGLVTTLMRLVFILYAEDRGLMPDHRVYQQHYSLSGLFSRLRADAAAWPDTMDQRFGAWAQLLSLFRLIHGGGGHGDLSFVARRGALFDPHRFGFLEGRHGDDEPSIPLVPDGCVWKVLRSLMMLDGERLSYRTLDVEQIGSVYEAIMGFRVETTTGRSIAVASPKRTGAAVVVDLDHLIGLDGARRAKALQDATARKLPDKAARVLRQASTIPDLVAALDRVIDRDATPDVTPIGTPVLQPSDERRRSGSHYTPRSLTEPIVREALRPVLARLGPEARPEEILDLKVLDPATGSAAFLVETCRQLSVRLVEAWGRHGAPQDLGADEDQLLHARRLVAQRCLYGVDRNAMAIDLGRLALWLVTLSRDHEFIFVDHALRHGDSLVGLSRQQIEGFSWDADAKHFQLGTDPLQINKRLERVAEIRNLIRDIGDQAGEEELRELLDEVEEELSDINLTAALVLAAFFAAHKPREREELRLALGDMRFADHWREQISQVVSERLALTPFHWELEFPEVFDRDNPGFDVIVGNPPFAGKNTLIAGNPDAYLDWLKHKHRGSHGNADLAAHFFRHAFGLLRQGGTLGLIATNTIGQGDTRSTGLRWICKNGGEIYRVQKRLKWPGEAAVVVSVVHIIKEGDVSSRSIDEKEVESISAFLAPGSWHDDPERLEANARKSFQGSIVLGMGFTFDDTDTKGAASSLSDMERLIEDDPSNADVIFPYIGGEEVNTSPTHAHHRHVINFRNWPLRRMNLGRTWRWADGDAKRDWLRSGTVPLDYPDPVAADWPELLAIVEARVKPARAHLTTNAIGRKRADFWWRYGSSAGELYAAINGMNRVLVISRVGQQAAFTFLPGRLVYAESMIVFPFGTVAAFCALQSRLHESWARFFGSSMEDRLRYTPSDCFETFPFPEDWETHPALEEAGEAYYEFRAALMVENNEGLTRTYNRFHDPDERDPRIEELRRLHAVMDRAVLDAYGWRNIPTRCEFLLDYDIDEETWGRKKKPWRYRWPDEVRDEVLGQLLALNAERADEEQADSESATDPRRKS